MNLMTQMTLDDEPGNTGTGSSKNRKSQYWFFTFNNYDTTDIDFLTNIFDMDCEKYCFQEEMGESGTKHLQGVVVFKVRKELNYIKRINPKIHWEICKNLRASVEYCSKALTRNGVCKYKGFNINLVDIPPYDEERFRVCNEILKGMDHRKIHWVFDPNGNSGKTCFGKNKYLTEGICYLKGGKGNDLNNYVYNWKGCMKRFIFDIPRCNEGYVSYNSIEQIKDGTIWNGKYETGLRIFNPPVVLIFANFEPDYNKLSNDRWVIYKW